MGYRLQLSDSFAARLAGQPGIRYTFVNNGSTRVNGGWHTQDLYVLSTSGIAGWEGTANLEKQHITFNLGFRF